MPTRAFQSIALAAFVLAGPVGCDLSPSEPDPPVLLQGELVPVGTERLISGSVAAVTQFGDTQISLSISGLEPQETLSWYLREGTCSGSGTVFGSPGAYPTLEANAEGEAFAEIGFPIRLRPGRNYAAEVVPQAGNGNSLACADLATA